ncbi:alpha/beta fold hydrolase [Companilactobacillus nodensis]|uniref:Alpha beta hydrolase fold protein n=1 Tax=Companilactobacillus nodensis DSM 19682 = JCM 14932 = NBRC 107160 TaxID=1423775 RepID=A0A0R1KHN1_9LACO|nr:alpha/beta hydrolase [Companilactobacillus nodensis]KRK81043.1 alpha beta hydrolase fold protein [Companilactobacillus nodensis DSM 19682 = JCM 14932 = NBRC 107160]
MEKIYEVTRGKVNIKVAGDLESDKKVIVLIPGINGSVDYYDEITPYLQKKYTVVSIDLLGQGKSSKSDSGEYDMDLQAWAILEGIARLRITDNMILFGYGIGGLIANRVAEVRDFSVSKLIMLNTPANAKYADMDAHSSFAAIPLLGRMAKSPVKSSLYFAKNFDTSKLKNPNVINDAANAVDRKTAKKLSKMADDYLEDKAMNKRLRATGFATLAIFSDDDQILTEAGIKDAKATIGRVPHLTIKDLKGAGHVGMIERPEEVANMIIDFDDSVEDVIKVDM